MADSLSWMRKGALVRASQRSRHLLQRFALFWADLWAVPSYFRRSCEALERLAAIQARVPEWDGVDRSAAIYTDDYAAAALEERQIAYALRTGIVLGPGVEPPGPVDEGGREWGS